MQQKTISKQKSLHAKNPAQQTNRLRPENLWDVPEKTFKPNKTKAQQNKLSGSKVIWVKNLQPRNSELKI
jgi:hypothetical protein